LARSIPNKLRRERKRKQRKAIIIASTDASRLNIRSALGLQLFKLWMFEPRECLTMLQASIRRQTCQPLSERDGDYTRLY
jgi:hypothetical protein